MRRRTSFVVRSLVVAAVCTAVVPLSSGAQTLGECVFRGTFEWTRTGPASYAVTLSADATAATCTVFGAAHYEGSGVAAHVGRCSVETAPGGLPWPTLDGMYISGVVSNASGPIDNVDISQGNPGRHAFPGPIPIPLYVHVNPTFFDPIPDGFGTLSTRIFGNCPPNGTNRAYAALTFVPFL